MALKQVSIPSEKVRHDHVETKQKTKKKKLPWDDVNKLVRNLCPLLGTSLLHYLEKQCFTTLHSVNIEGAGRTKSIAHIKFFTFTQMAGKINSALVFG